VFQGQRDREKGLYCKGLPLYVALA
jgi:hypothetical protein